MATREELLIIIQVKQDEVLCKGSLRKNAKGRCTENHSGESVDIPGNRGACVCGMNQSGLHT